MLQVYGAAIRVYSQVVDSAVLMWTPDVLKGTAGY